jgi:hypothetical protein
MFTPKSINNVTLRHQVIRSRWSSIEVIVSPPDYFPCITLCLKVDPLEQTSRILIFAMFHQDTFASTGKYLSKGSEYVK